MKRILTLCVVASLIFSLTIPTFAANETTGIYEVDGQKVYYLDGVRQNTTDVIKINGGWYNLVDGVVTANTVAKNKNGWWYIDENGKVDFSFTGIATNSHGSWYCKGGKVQFGVTDVICTTYHGVKAWYNIKGGQLVKGPTVAKNKNGWWYIDENGKVDFSYTGIAENKNGWWYTKCGKLRFDYSGTIEQDGVSYDVKYGRVAIVDMDHFLETAISAAGNTLYVWGGGWNEEDDGSGKGALTIGLLPDWKKFFDANRNGYDYHINKEKWENGEDRLYISNTGLDCSGFVGWAVYNAMKKERQESGYVTSSTKMAKSLADLGYGTVKNSTASDTFYPGDIVSIKGHVFICLGQCSDGSVLILHSKPNGGVQVSGTRLANGNSSVATTLAKKFMKKYYPKWYESFGDEGTYSVDPDLYLTGVKFSWNMNTNIKNIAGDKNHLRDMTGEEVLSYLSAYVQKQ